MGVVPSIVTLPNEDSTVLLTTSRLNQTLRTFLMLGAVLSVAACSSEDSGGTSFVVPAKARGLLPDLALADTNFEGDHFSGSSACGTCHTDSAPIEAATMIVVEAEVPRNVSIGTAWESSIMAQGARDPYWHAIVATELHLYPNLSDEINDKCTRCHAPMANELAKKTGQPIQLFDALDASGAVVAEGYYDADNTNDLFNHAMDGISCTACHQIEDVGFGDKSSMSGGFTIATYSEENRSDRPAYGQYADPDAAYMIQQSGFSPQYSLHISTSEMCATCHNLDVDVVDTEGNLVGTHFAEQTMYTEWKESAFNNGSPDDTCQGCHMPTLSQAVPIANLGSSVSRDDFAEHTFLGANTIMQTMMDNYSEELGIDPNIDFQSSIIRNREFLKSSATLELLAQQKTGNGVSFDLKVTNHAGHKLPSGYHSRRAYIHLVITDAAGLVVFESGSMNANGSINGVDEDADPSSWEPHYDVITNANQVQVYQGVTGNSDGVRTHSLLNSFNFLKDNRITPMGFDKNAVNVDVAVTGGASTDPDFNQGSDTVTYQLSLPQSGSYTVQAELRYQPFSYGHLAHVFSYGEEIDQVDMFRTIYDNTELRDEVIATVVGTVQ